MLSRGLILAVVFVLQAVWCSLASAQPEGFVGAVAGEKTEILLAPIRVSARAVPLPKKSKLQSLPDLHFLGPMPGHPFVLGTYAVDGTWGIVSGAVQVVSGKNAALQLAWANDFVLEGNIEQSGLGGWFFLLGWDEGRGYAVSNVLMKESGSPWFITEFRGGKAIPDRNEEFDKFDWKGDQPFRLTVQDQKMTLEVGPFRVFDAQPLPGYAPGRVVIGIYDTRYGPKTLRIKSLKIRALAEEEEPAGK